MLRSAETDQFVASSGAGYVANAEEVADAEAFVMKPSSLGEYIIYNRAGQLITTGATAGNTDLVNATNDNIFVVKIEGDNTPYPAKPIFEPVPTNATPEPDAAFVTAYRGFAELEPNLESTRFTFVSESTGDALAVDGTGALVSEPVAVADRQVFIPENATGCTEFPEADSNTVGETFSGTTADDRVLGMVDGHVHISATTFLGRAEWGFPFHPFGVTHALSNCDEYHGSGGTTSVVQAAFEEDPDGHNTTGWPTFPEWPARNNKFHEAIYWKWVERAWMSGMRIIVNDLVENETLCELSRNVSGDATMDCNSMNSAGRQAYTMYAMQDYIDAQYGGRGEGFFQIVLDPDEAREVIEDGKVAVILGIEISNLMTCKVNYGPARTQEPFEETGEGGTEPSYTCSAETIETDLQRMWGWGVRQVITIHEFDNAFGGNGIFDGLVLNLGSRENSGGVPGNLTTNPLDVVAGNVELPTGEFWTTYDCPMVGIDTEWPRGPDDASPAEEFDGYIFDNEASAIPACTQAGGDTNRAGGTCMTSPRPCTFAGQNGRPGGTTPCYPAARQCNARWLTPLGLTFYSKLMEYGFIFDIDHLAVKMKSQALDLAEAQNIPYPFVSTHGTFGGITKHQARRMFANGGLIYPSIGSSAGLVNDMREMKGYWEDAGSPRGFFGFGFGTDTNGLSNQTGPRGSKAISERPIIYPYTLFDGGFWESVPEFAGVAGVVFELPGTRDASGEGRDWHADVDGNAHYGMMSANVHELTLEATPEDMSDLFYAAENYLQMWTQTVASSDAMAADTASDSDGDGVGNAIIPTGVLKQAPVPDTPFTTDPP